MLETNKIGILITLALFISGCVASSETVKPTTMPEQTGSIVQEQVVPETPPAIEQPAAEIAPEESVVAEQVAPQVVMPAESQPTAITYSQITNLIGEFVDIQPVETASSEPRFSGSSENKLVTLELVGDKNNISQASIRLAYPDDISAVNADLNKAMMLRFLRNAVPGFRDWPARVSSIIGKFNAMDADKERDDMLLNGRAVNISYDRPARSIRVTVTR